MKKKFVWITMLAASLLLLAACGGSAEPVENGVEPSPTNTAAPALDPVEPSEDAVDEVEEAEAEEPASEEPAAEEPAAEETADLPTLPRLDAAPAGAAAGLGGVAESAAIGAPEVSTLSLDAEVGLTRPFYPDVFSQTTFILNTTLPLEPTQAIVEQQQPLPMDAARATAIAQQFGFNGPLYQELFPDNGVELPFMPTIFRAFDGQAELNIDMFGVYYTNLAVQDEVDFANPLSVEQRIAIAEAFLQERGLLNFPYVIQEGFGADVQVMRQLGSYTIEAPVFIVTVGNNSEVAFVYYQSTEGLEQLGDYPLRSAEEAWQLIQSGVQENGIPFIILPNFDETFVMPVEPALIEDIRFWNREYLPGEEAHIYGWPSVFVPVDGAGAPRINFYPFTLAGDEAQLNSIVELFGQNLHVWGTVSEDGQTLQVTGWEVLNDANPLSLEGTVVRDGETVRLDTIEGDSYLLPNAPEDLPGGISVYIFAWSARDVGAQFPVLDWENIDEAFLVGDTGIVEPEPIIAEPIPDVFEAPSYAEVTINSVTLIYTQMPFFNEPLVGEDAVSRDAFEQPTLVNQPVWKFSGTTDSGETVEFFVQAAAPELIQ